MLNVSWPLTVICATAYLSVIGGYAQPQNPLIKEYRSAREYRSLRKYRSLDKQPEERFSRYNGQRANITRPAELSTRTQNSLNSKDYVQSRGSTFVDEITTVSSSGTFVLGESAILTFTSPNYPDNYSAFSFTTWKFKTEPSSLLLQLTCDEFDLDQRFDSLVVTASSEWKAHRYTQLTGPPGELVVEGSLKVRLITDFMSNGKFCCTVRTFKAVECIQACANIRMKRNTTEEAAASVYSSATEPVELYLENHKELGLTQFEDVQIGSSKDDQVFSPGLSGVAHSDRSPQDITKSAYARAPVCGVANLNRIVGGENAPPNAYPWLVGLVPAGGVTPFCAGSIYSNTVVITSAQCAQAVTNPSQIRVLLGKHQYQDDPDQISVEVSQITLHPDFDGITFDNDIAILRFSTPLDCELLLDRVGSVCLPPPTCEGDLTCYIDSPAVVAGWGTLQEDGTARPTTLQQATVSVIDNPFCGCSYCGLVNITDNMLCAAVPGGGKDACLGDGGGPLMVEDDDGVFTLIGIVSFGNGCGRAEYPGGYTRVSEYYSWILSNSA